MKDINFSKLLRINTTQAFRRQSKRFNNFLFTGMCLYITALETIVLSIRCVSERALQGMVLTLDLFLSVFQNKISVYQLCQASPYTWNCTSAVRRIFIKFKFRVFDKYFLNKSITLKLHKNRRNICLKICGFMKIFLRFLKRMRNVSEEPCKENLNTYFMPNNSFHKIEPFMT